MSKKIDGTNLGYLLGLIKDFFWPKADVVQIGIDSTPTANSTNLVTSGGVKAYVDGAVGDIESALSTIIGD